MPELQIGNVKLENDLILSTDGRSNRPAISSALQRAGSRAALHGDGQCEGELCITTKIRNSF